MGFEPIILRILVLDRRIAALHLAPRLRVLLALSSSIPTLPLIQTLADSSDTIQWPSTKHRSPRASQSIWTSCGTSCLAGWEKGAC